MLHIKYWSISYSGYLPSSEFAKYCCMEMVLGHSSTEAAAALRFCGPCPPASSAAQGTDQRLRCLL